MICANHVAIVLVIYFKALNDESKINKFSNLSISLEIGSIKWYARYQFFSIDFLLIVPYIFVCRTTTGTLHCFLVWTSTFMGFLKSHAYQQNYECKHEFKQSPALDSVFFNIWFDMQQRTDLDSNSPIQYWAPKFKIEQNLRTFFERSRFWIAF